MIPTTVTHPTGWPTAAALGALAVRFVVLTGSQESARGQLTP